MSFYFILIKKIILFDITLRYIFELSIFNNKNFILPSVESIDNIFTSFASFKNVYFITLSQIHLNNLLKYQYMLFKIHSAILKIFKKIYLSLTRQDSRRHEQEV